MSDIMLHGVLNMPPELWCDSPIDVMQRHSRYVQASQYIDELIEQRDKLAVALRECRDDSIELLGERDWWQRESRGDYQERYQEIRDNVTRADAALQSLTTTEL